jgi:hypothetical protein
MSNRELHNKRFGLVAHAHDCACLDRQLCKNVAQLSFQCTEKSVYVGRTRERNLSNREGKISLMAGHTQGQHAPFAAV